MFGTAQDEAELLSNLVFEGCGSCGELTAVGGYNPVFEHDASDGPGKLNNRDKWISHATAA